MNPTCENTGRIFYLFGKLELDVFQPHLSS